jgi:hypothetical protein
MTTTHVRTHVLVGFANPYLVCDTCKGTVRYWHDPDRCSSKCESPAFNSPCKDELGVTSICPSWSPVDGCTCETACSK